MNWDVLLDVGQWVLTGLGAAAAALRIVAPKTSTKKDDAVAGKLDKVRDWTAKFLGLVVIPRTLKK